MHEVPQTPRVKVYIGLGSNLGDREHYLRCAIESLRKTEEFTVQRVSRLYETEPVGNTKQPFFLNAVLEGQTSLSPKTLLATLKEIEKVLGRVHREKWGPREIDLDLLFYGDQVIQETDLTVPHPHLHERDFVLVPLSELCATWIHPTLRKSIGELLTEGGVFHASHPKPYPIEV